LRAAGWRLARAAIAVAVLLGAIEVIQIHLPGRVAEITDPLLALILAMTLGLLDRSERVLSNLSSKKFRGCDVELR
jgi:VanZ family protein